MHRLSLRLGQGVSEVKVVGDGMSVFGLCSRKQIWLVQTWVSNPKAPL